MEYFSYNLQVIGLLNDGHLLQQPDTCCDDVFSLMLGCWRNRPKQRFNFKQIHALLVDMGKKHTLDAPTENPGVPVQSHAVSIQSNTAPVQSDTAPIQSDTAPIQSYTVSIQ